MWADCIDRMGSGCAGCERRDACSELFAGLFNWREAARAPRPPVPRRSNGLFASVLREVARSVQANMAARRAAQQQAEAATREAPEAAAEAPARPLLGDAFQKEVEAHLEPLLGAGAIGIESVARALGLSRQTLYRRLKAEGTTFEAVLDRLRRRLALRYIGEQGMAVKEAAYRLGFSDPAAFSRAFKRWTGASPKASRR
jgi:AraC-like DNA-binding protein